VRRKNEQAKNRALMSIYLQGIRETLYAARNAETPNAHLPHFAACCAAQIVAFETVCLATVSQSQAP
jgi:primosomal protein N''